MKRKNLILIAILFAIAIIYIVYKQLPSNLTSAKIALKNSHLINKISIIPEDKSPIILTKAKHWSVNKKYEANKKSIELLLQTLSGLQISEVTNKTIATENKTGTIIKLFEGKVLKKKIKIIEFVKARKATLIEVDDIKKYIYANVPGLVNDLKTRIVANPLYWRTRKIISLPANQIAKLSIDYQKKEKSFSLQQNYQLTINDYLGNSIDFDKEKADFYLANFFNIHFEKAITTYSILQKEALQKQNPLFILTLLDKTGNKYSIKGYPMPNEDEPENIDTNRFIALINNDSEVVIMKYYDLDLILKTINYFGKK